MEQMEIFYWVTTLKMANKGDEEAIQILREENQMRIDKGQMTVQEELEEIRQEMEMTENARTIYRREKK